MSFLRAYDRDLQLRLLRRLLPNSPPPSWESEDLLRFARRELESGSPSADLLAQAARTFAVFGHDDVVNEICENGVRRDPAKFHSILAHYVHHRSGDLEAAARAARRGLEVTWHRSVDKAELLVALAKSQMRLGDLDGADRTYHTCIVQNVRSMLPIAHLGLSWVSQLRQEFRRARTFNLAAETLFDQQGDDFGLLSVGSDRAVLEYSAGNHDVAEREFEKVIRGRLGLLDADRITTDLSNYAVLLRVRGRPRQAIDLLKEGIRYCEHLGKVGAAAGTFVNLGNSYQNLGRRQEAIGAFQWGVRLSRRVGACDYEFRSLVGLLEAVSVGSTELPTQEVARCAELLKASRAKLSKETVTSFERLLATRPDRRDAEIADETHRHDSRSWKGPILDVEHRLRAEVGSGPPSKAQIEPGRIVRFLWQYARDPFQNGDYRSELFVDRPAARSHLRWLTLQGIVGKEGSRRGSSYRLAIRSDGA